MAHECPNCGMTCHCGGDIDDICFSGTPEELGCLHCDGDDADVNPGVWCSTCGCIESEDEHEPHCPLFENY